MTCLHLQKENGGVPTKKMPASLMTTGKKTDRTSELLERFREDDPASIQV